MTQNSTALLQACIILVQWRNFIGRKRKFLVLNPGAAAFSNYHSAPASSIIFVPVSTIHFLASSIVPG
jgi:hypothetical protein